MMIKEGKERERERKEEVFREKMQSWCVIVTEIKNLKIIREENGRMKIKKNQE